MHPWNRLTTSVKTSGVATRWTTQAFNPSTLSGVCKCHQQREERHRQMAARVSNCPQSFPLEALTGDTQKLNTQISCNNRSCFDALSRPCFTNCKNAGCNSSLRTLGRAGTSYFKSAHVSETNTRRPFLISDFQSPLM